MTTSARLVVGVMALAVVTGLCLPSWATIAKNPAVAGMWAMLALVILLLIFVGGRNNGHR